MYFASRKAAAKKADKKLRESFRKDPDRQYSVYGDNNFSDDDYNRRGVVSNANYKLPVGTDSLVFTADSFDMTLVEDTVKGTSRAKVVVYSNLSDLEDYFYSRRLSRLHHNYYYHSPYYWDVYCGSYWYDPWYDPWFYHHGWGWYNSWYDPYFYGYSWYGWNPWYYGWYAGYGPHYWYYHHGWYDYYYTGYYYGGGYGVSQRASNFHHRASYSGINYSGGQSSGSNSRFSNTYGGVRSNNRRYSDAATVASHYGERGGALSSRYGYDRNGSANSSSNSGTNRRTLYNPGSNSANSGSYNRSSNSHTTYTPSTYNNSSSTRSSSSSSSYSSGGGASHGSSYRSGGAGSRGGGGGGGRR